MPEKECAGKPEVLLELLNGLMADSARREDMSRNLREMAVPDASEHIYQTLVGLMKKG